MTTGFAGEDVPTGVAETIAASVVSSIIFSLENTVLSGEETFEVRAFAVAEKELSGSFTRGVTFPGDCGDFAFSALALAAAVEATGSAIQAAHFAVTPLEA